MLLHSLAGFLLLPYSLALLLTSLVTALMLPSRPSEFAVGVLPVRETGGGDPSTARNSNDPERHVAPAFKTKQFKMPEGGAGPVGSGPRPLLLGTFKIATASSAASVRQRPLSSSPRSPRTPTVAPVRWSSYTTPLTPPSKLPFSQASDEVRALKARLAASETLVKELTKEKFEAVSASRELWEDVKRIQAEQTQWLNEREELVAQLRLLEEVNATPGLLPSSEGVCSAGSDQTLSQAAAPFLPPIHVSRHGGDLEILPSRSYQVPEAGVGRPVASDHIHSELVVSKKKIIGDDATLASIGALFLASKPMDDGDGCNPSNTSSPTVRVSRPAASYRASSKPVVSQIDILGDDETLERIGSIFLASAPVNDQDGPNTLSSTSTPIAQAPRPQPDLVDLASRLVGSDPCPEYPGRRKLNNGAESFFKEVNAAAAAGSRPSFNFATEVELHAAMARVSASTARPRLASEFPKWPEAISEPQIQKGPVDPLRESGFAALVRSKRQRPIPKLRARGFMPSSSPLANPPLTNPAENTEEEQTRAEIGQVEPASTLPRRGGAPLDEAGMDGLSSSPLVNLPTNAKQGQPKRRQLGKLLKRVKSWISRSA